MTGVRGGEKTHPTAYGAFPEQADVLGTWHSRWIGAFELDHQELHRFEHTAARAYEGRVCGLQWAYGKRAPAGCTRRVTWKGF